MGDKTGIQWTDATWNPIVGCSIVSPGCTNCYAMSMAARIQRMTPGSHYAGTTLIVSQNKMYSRPHGKAVWTGKVVLAPDHILTQPMRWAKPRMIFVNSMGDLFHESVPDEWIDRVFAIMALAPQHTFQVLTKRSARMRAYLGTRAGDWTVVWPDANPPGSLPISRHEQRLAMRGAGWPDAILRPTFPLPNVWMGVSAEDQRRADERVPDLLATTAAIRFVSAEPLLSGIDFRRLKVRDFELDALTGAWSISKSFEGGFGAAQEAIASLPTLPARLPGLSQIIVGGESGPRARPMHPRWPRDIRDQCAAAGTAFFMKQMSGPVKARMPAIPDDLMIREMPHA